MLWQQKHRKKCHEKYQHLYENSGLINSFRKSIQVLSCRWLFRWYVNQYLRWFGGGLQEDSGNNIYLIKIFKQSIIRINSINSMIGCSLMEKVKLVGWWSLRIYSSIHQLFAFSNAFLFLVYSMLWLVKYKYFIQRVSPVGISESYAYGVKSTCLLSFSLPDDVLYICAVFFVFQPFPAPLISV